MGRDLADIVSGRTQVPPTWIVWMTICTVVMVVAAAGILGHYMRKAVKARLHLQRGHVRVGAAEEGRVEHEPEGEVMGEAEKNENAFEGGSSSKVRGAELSYGDSNDLTQSLVDSQ